MQRIAVNPSAIGGSVGAASKPHNPEKTTRLITRGLVSARKSRQSAGSAAGLVISMAGIGAAYKDMPGRGKPCVAKFIFALLWAAAMNHRFLAATLFAALAAPVPAQS